MSLFSIKSTTNDAYISNLSNIPQEIGVSSKSNISVFLEETPSNQKKEEDIYKKIIKEMKKYPVFNEHCTQLYYLYNKNEQDCKNLNSYQDMLKLAAKTEKEKKEEYNNSNNNNKKDLYKNWRAAISKVQEIKNNILALNNQIKKDEKDIKKMEKSMLNFILQIDSLEIGLEYDVITSGTMDLLPSGKYTVVELKDGKKAYQCGDKYYEIGLDLLPYNQLIENASDNN